MFKMRNNEPQHFVRWCVHSQNAWRGDSIYLVLGTKRQSQQWKKKQHYKLNKKEVLFTVFFGKVNAIVISEKERLLFENNLFCHFLRWLIIRGNPRGRDIEQEQIYTKNGLKTHSIS